MIEDWRRRATAQLTDVLAVEVADSAGGLARVLATTDEAGLDIEYMYAFSTAPGQQAVVIIRFSDPDRALAERSGAASMWSSR